MGREREAPQKPQQQQEEVVSYTVEQLVAVNPYNPDILPDLENYVNEQVSFSLFASFFFSFSIPSSLFFFVGLKT
jgi:translation initiation factor 3 subunit K